MIILYWYRNEYNQGKKRERTVLFLKRCGCGKNRIDHVLCMRVFW